jgi:hypothetical protein
MKKYQEEQPHRARFHNVFVMAIGYLLSPFFALGIFLHAFQDSFTTVKDRGCEWFYPLTRRIKRGTLDTNGKPQPPIEPGKIFFYQEDQTVLLSTQTQTYKNLTINLHHGDESMGLHSTVAY